MYFVMRTAQDAVIVPDRLVFEYEHRGYTIVTCGTIEDCRRERLHMEIKR